MIGKDENTLLNVLNILDGNSFQYWVSNGTLLGLVREGRVLPWDNDIDISVWSHEVSKEFIIELLKPHGFEVAPLSDYNDCLHFIVKGNGKKTVDVGFYEIRNSIAKIRWLAPRQDSGVLSMLRFSLSIFDEDLKLNSIKGNWSFVKYLLYIIIRPIVLIRPSYFQKIKKKYYMPNFFHQIGYTYPVSLLKKQGYLHKFGKMIPVPRDYEQVLEMTYGEDWRTPKKDYVWHEDAKNLH